MSLPPDDPARQAAWEDAKGVLDQELHALAEHLRRPLKLCYLLGYSHETAAKHLGLNPETLRNITRGYSSFR